MGRSLESFFLVIGLVIGSAWIWVVERPMAFLAHDYPTWKLKRDMVHNLPPESLAILGDSRALAGFVPAEIGPGVYNLGLGGGTSIEASVLARTLISSPHPPRAVILSISPLHCMLTDSFWDAGVKYGLLDRATVEEVRVRARRSNDLVAWAGNLNDRSLLFGPVTIGDIDARLKIDLYSIRWPSFYFRSIVAGGIYRRGADNVNIYRDVREARGYSAYGKLDGCRKLSVETKLSVFKPSPLLDSYLSETIALFQSKKIPVYFIAAPINEVSSEALHPGFASDYESYIKSYERRYPYFHRLGDPLPTFPWTNYSDPDHLNAHGAQVFSNQVARLIATAPRP